METNIEVREGWAKILRSIFPLGIPQSCEWTDKYAIHDLLYVIGLEGQSNQMLFANGCRMNLIDARYSSEYNCVELRTSGPAYIVRPTKLSFESFNGPAPKWGYFRLEFANLKPSRFCSNPDAKMEEVCEFEPGEYIHDKHWIDDEYDGERLPETARMITRIMHGSLIISEAGALNTVNYDENLETMSNNEVRSHIENATTFNFPIDVTYENNVAKFTIKAMQ